MKKTTKKILICLAIAAVGLVFFAIGLWLKQEGQINCNRPQEILGWLMEIPGLLAAIIAACYCDIKRKEGK